MTDVFLLQNQNHCYLDKHSNWIEGSDVNSLYRTTHKDEAVNQRLELTVRDPDLRIAIIPCKLDEKGRPCIPTPTHSVHETVQAAPAPAEYCTATDAEPVLEQGRGPALP